MALTKISTGMLKADAASVDLNIDAGTLFLDVANNRIGIANTSPAAALHIGGSGHLLFERGGEVRSKDTGGSVRTIARVDNVNRLQYGWSGAGGVLFMGGGSYTERMRIHTNGYVGIGTTTPAAELSVSGTGTVLRLESSGAYVDMFMQNSSNTGFVNLDAQKMNFYVGGGSASHLKMSILTGGNVGIGTTTPNYLLDVEGTGATIARLNSTSGAAVLQISVPDTTSINDINFGDSGSTTSGQIRYRHNGDSLAISTAGSERMRIDSSGNLLVGKTASNIATDGIELGTRVESTADGSYALRLNRRNSDGDIAQFRKDGSVIGNIGANGGDLYIGTGDTNVLFADGSDSIIPANTGGASRNNAINLGVSGTRFKDLYLSGIGYIGGGEIYLGTADSSSGHLNAYENMSFNIDIDNDDTNRYFSFNKNGASASGTELMRLTEDGNLLVGTTDNTLYNNATGGGIALTADNRLDVARQGDVLATFNRTGNSQGQILQFRKDATVIGTIGTSGSDLYIQNGITGLSFNDANNAILPHRSGAVDDANIDIGLSSNRFKNLHLSGMATIHDITSDGVIRSTNNANVDGPNFNVSTTNKSTSEYAYRVDRSGTVVGGLRIDGSALINSRLTFGYNSHYFEAGTNSVAFKNSSGTSYISITNTGTSITGQVLVGANESRFAENNLRFKSAGAGYIDHNTTGQSVYFRVSNSSALDTTAITIKSTGKVGIGPTNPGTKLDVAGDIRALEAIYSEGSAPRVQLQDTDGTNQFSFFQQSSSQLSLRLRNDSADGSFRIAGYGGTTTTDRMIIGSTGDFSFYQDDGTTRMVHMDASSGRSMVGSIGTNVAIGRFHIVGNSDVNDEDCQLVITDVDGSSGSRIPSIRFTGYHNGAFLDQGRIRGTDTAGLVLSGSSTFGNDLVVQNTGIGIGAPSSTTFDSNITAYHATNAIKSLVKLWTNTADNTGTEGGAIEWVASGDKTAVGSKIAGTRVGAGAFMDLRFYTGRNTDSDHEKMRITKDGNVGIGTTNPTVGLQVGNSTSGETKTVIFNSEGGTEIGLLVKSRTNRAKFSIADNDTTGYLLAENSVLSLGFLDQAANNNINIKSGGRVGIGENDPTFTLQLGADTQNLGSITTNKQIVLNIDGGYSTNNSAQYKVMGFVGTTSGGTNDILGSTYTSGEQLKNFYLGLISPNSYFNNARFGIFQGGEERLTIKQGGNVGIGTTSPTTHLSVTNSGFSNTSTTGIPAIRTEGSYGGAIGLLDTKEAGWYAQDSGDTLYQYVGRASGTAPNASIVMTYKSDGKVGINDTNPDRKVSIIGDNTSEGKYPLSLDATDTDYTLEFRRNGTSAWWIKQASSSFNIHANGVGDHLRILASSGRTGIGHTNPEGQLHVRTTNTATPPIKITRGLDGGRIQLQYATNTSGFGEIGQIYHGTGRTKIWIGANLNSFSTAHSTITQHDTNYAAWAFVADSYSDEANIQRITSASGADKRLVLHSTGQVSVNTDTALANSKLNVDGGIRFNHNSAGGGLNTVSYQTFNNSNTANSCGTVYYSAFIINFYHNNGHSQILGISNGGGGVGFEFTVMRPDTGTLEQGRPINFSFTTEGSSPNTFTVNISSGGGALTVNRTSGTGAFGVSVHKLAGG